MKRKNKNILAVGLLLIAIAELLVYQSEWDFAHLSVYKIIFLNVIVSIGFIFWHSKESGPRILWTLATIGLGVFIFLFEFIQGFSAAEKQFNSWKIDEHEIIYAKQESYAGQGSKPYLKLRKIIFSGLFYQDIDEAKPNASFLELGTTECNVEFEKTKTEFDLCEKKQLNEPTKNE